MKHISSPRVLLIGLTLLGLPAVATACLWDYDTLKQERARFPSTLEIITGKFLRHSPEFYQWRITDRLEKLKADPNNLALHDDLAVAYQKTGQPDKAIEQMLAKEKIKPGVYETYSNLGTFYILKGEFEKGLPYIDKALAINPDAHFGREKYQKWLVEYAMRRKGSSLSFPLQDVWGKEEIPPASGNFRHFLAKKLDVTKDNEPSLDQLQAAVKGVLGMMRFADHDNPLLLEALGDLLGSDHGYAVNTDAKRLSARCYLLASHQMKDDASKDRYRTLAKHILDMQLIDDTENQQKSAVIEAELQTEVADANTWYAELKNKEVGWIASGANVETEFDKLYTKEPTSDLPSSGSPLSPEQRMLIYGPIFVIGSLLSLILIGWGIGRLARFIA
ncbi:tetratricopeptide repeat protein [Zavarzinella formosa]|uniref:tetratricopeptide repeat protein n=1 Tax=Zavarzinella formosa TaxID=360055 RepID=UPI00031B5F83|nr:hypothetical protein [Zavarzinella formosa]